MRIARTLIELQDARRAFGSVSLVPTMGALHAGHLALLAAAAAAGGPVAASIFVNPLQFGAGEDLARYPRDEAGDLAKLRGAGCALAWLPDIGVMYPEDAASRVTVAGPARRWEGELRPGHFAGVATVVAKLFGQVRPHAAYFGEKDWQQIQVVTRMVTDLSLPVRVVPVPTVREPDGLALSSRNRFLSRDERAAAPLLHMTLSGAAATIARGDDPEAALTRGRDRLAAAGMAVNYFAFVDANTLEPARRAPGRLLAAAQLGAVRLLDNVAVAASASWT